jgi:hypothetical protein
VSDDHAGDNDRDQSCVELARIEHRPRRRLRGHDTTRRQLADIRIELDTAACVVHHGRVRQPDIIPLSSSASTASEVRTSIITTATEIQT